MPFYYRDVNGPYQCCAENPQMFARVSRLTARLAWKDHGSGYAYLDGVNTGVMTEGNNPVAWGDDDSLYIQTDQSGRLLVLRPDGWQDRVDAPYRSEGIHHIAPDGTPVMGGGAHVTVREVELWNAMQDADGAWCGLSNGGGPSGCVAWIPANGPALMCVVDQDVQIPPRISQGVVVWSGQDSPAPADQVWVPFAPYEAPAPTLTVPANPRTVIRMAYGTPALPTANCTIPCDGAPWLTAPYADKGIVILPRPADDPSIDRISQATRKAQESGYAVGVYDDAHPWSETQQELQIAIDRGCAALWLMQCYPRPTLESDLMAVLSSPWRDRVLFVATCRENGDPNGLAESHRLVNRMIEMGVGQGVLYFDWRRAPTWLRAHIDAYCAATPNPDLGWLPTTPKPLVVEPAPVPVVPPVVTPPVTSHKSTGNSHDGGPGWVKIESPNIWQRWLGMRYRRA